MARLKTDAAHYLHELKATDPKGYQDLKKRYIASLHSHEAKAILDMQKILTTQHFDTQVRQSLVMFLVRHPAQWQSGARGASRVRSEEDKQRSAEAILKSLLS